MVDQNQVAMQTAQRQQDILRLLQTVNPGQVRGLELDHVAAAAHNAMLDTVKGLGLSLAPAFNATWDYLNDGNKSYYRALVDTLLLFLARQPNAQIEQEARERQKEVDSVALAEMVPCALHGTVLQWHQKNNYQIPPHLAVDYFHLRPADQEIYRAMAEGMLRAMERRGAESSIWGDPWGK